MKKNFKNLMALVLTGAMLTAGTAAFADSTFWTGVKNVNNKGSFSGSGASVSLATLIEVEIPTDSKFDFVLDPSSFLASATMDDVTITEPGTILFDTTTKDDDGTVLSKKSAPVEFKNKSSVPVNLKVTAEAKPGNSKIGVVDGVAKLDGKAAQVALKLGVVDGVEEELKSKKATVNTMIEDSANLITLEKIPGSGYSFSASYDPEEDGWKTAGVYLTGDADSDADWDDDTINAAEFKVDVAYELSLIEKSFSFNTEKDTKALAVDLKGVTKDTASIRIKALTAADNAGEMYELQMADLTGYVTMAADKATFTPDALAALKGFFGGECKLSISAPGSQGAYVTIK